MTRCEGSQTHDPGHPDMHIQYRLKTEHERLGSLGRIRPQRCLMS